MSNNFDESGWFDYGLIGAVAIVGIAVIGIGMHNLHQKGELVDMLVAAGMIIGASVGFVVVSCGVGYVLCHAASNVSGWLE